MIRQPIVTVMGHVDHGKTSILDRIRRTSVSKREAGAITQHIGASEVPTEAIEGVCGSAMNRVGTKLKIPGLLFIDTPGHEAFTNLRRRGGSIADIAVLVVDLMQGFQPQTLEALEILKEYKTPFVVAANKVDLIPGWVNQGEVCFLKAMEIQPPKAQAALEERVYELVGKLHGLGFESERFDRITEFTKQILIVPVSAKTGEGIPDLLLYLAGLSQKFLEKRLDASVSGPGKGTILEVKEERGLGTTLDVILYDGVLKKGDSIVYGTRNGSSTAKVRALLEPKPLDEMRDPKEKFSYVEEVHAASGVKISAPGMEGALPGSPVMVCDGNEEELKESIKQEIQSLFVKSSTGIMLRADTLGSLEAIVKLLAAQEIQVHSADIGPVTKHDVLEAVGTKLHDPFNSAILAFHVPVNEDAAQEAHDNVIPVFEENVVYSLIENFVNWQKTEKEKEKNKASSELVYPAKIKLIPGCCFRASKPAIFGVEVVAGKIKTKTEMMSENGEKMGTVKSLQHDKENIQEAEKGMQIAVSMDDVTYGRSVCENHVLYSIIPKEHCKLFDEKYTTLLTDEDRKVLEEIKKILKYEVW